MKFESILRDDSLQFFPLILRVDSDLKRFSKMNRYNRSQGAGSIAVLCNPPGQGKTTAAYAASVLLKESFNPILSVPTQIALPLRDVGIWLSKNLPPERSDKTTIVLIDGRESTDDEQGLRDVMGALNNVVRGRPDLLFVWPTTDTSWRDRLVSTARDFGGLSFCPDHGVASVDGPAPSQWVEAVALMLDQLKSSWDEFGINEASATEMIKSGAYRTLGEFFTAINQIRTDQEDEVENVSGLPELVFVVSSFPRVVSEVARLRNPTNYRIRTDEVIGSARGQEVGKFWRDRGARQKGNLAWVSSLLRAQLVTVTPSTVAHACGLYADPDSTLRARFEQLEFRPQRRTGQTAYQTTDLARFLNDKPVPEVLNSNKGKTSESTLAAYAAVQEMSSKAHRDINKAILRLAATTDDTFDIDEVLFEVPLGGDAIADAVVTASRRLHIEFHHLSETHCNPNRIATYVMKKLRTYATQYNLIER